MSSACCEATTATTALPGWSPADRTDFAAGLHRRLFEHLGAHPADTGSPDGGTRFAVWAPHAQAVSVVGDFNDWRRGEACLQCDRASGIWWGTVPEARAGQLYKYALTNAAGENLPLKCDPFAFAGELRPRNASRIAPLPDPVVSHRWPDRPAPAERAISIYEVHVGSWRRRADGSPLDWDELAETLIPYVAGLGFTHLELMPIAEYPHDPSWGYQATGLFAPTARHGCADALLRFVSAAHAAGLGVLLDWVPSHFPTDPHGLYRFDGTPLYEHADPRLGYHRDWDSAIYDYGCGEVVSFLVSSAVYWLDRFGFDGLRVDAVASMLYRDYSRPADDWLPNEEGGNENWEAVGFLRKLTAAVHAEMPSALIIAEESTAWPGVTLPAEGLMVRTGLGFDFKWNMGFMHDALGYFARPSADRASHRAELAFGLTYAAAENYLLPLSHDEVVHLKRSLIEKMSGSDDAERFANLRAFYAMMWAYPGKKLLFMGQEFAQRSEWDEARSLDWDVLERDRAHGGVRDLIVDLNRLYRNTPALHLGDCRAEGWRWIDTTKLGDDAVFGWRRDAPGATPVIMLGNFGPRHHAGARIDLGVGGTWRELLNSDSKFYGGGNRGNGGRLEVSEGEGELSIPPLTTLYLSPGNS